MYSKVPHSDLTGNANIPTAAAAGDAWGIGWSQPYQFPNRRDDAKTIGRLCGPGPHNSPMKRGTRHGWEVRCINNTWVAMKTRTLTKLVLSAATIGCSDPPSAITDDDSLVSVEVRPTVVDIGIADTVRVFAYAEPCLRARPPYTWTVQDSIIATVHARSDTSAVVIGRAPGEVSLVVKSSNGVIGAAPVRVRVP